MITVGSYRPVLPPLGDSGTSGRRKPIAHRHVSVASHDHVGIKLTTVGTLVTASVLENRASSSVFSLDKGFISGANASSLRSLPPAFGRPTPAPVIALRPPRQFSSVKDIEERIVKAMLESHEVAVERRIDVIKDVARVCMVGDIENPESAAELMVF